MQAKDIQIGDRVPHHKKNEMVTVRELNELCIDNPTPHVHVLTDTDGHRCFGFNSFPLAHRGPERIAREKAHRTRVRDAEGQFRDPVIEQDGSVHDPKGTRVLMLAGDYLAGELR